MSNTFSSEITSGEITTIFESEIFGYNGVNDAFDINQQLLQPIAEIEDGLEYY